MSTLDLPHQWEATPSNPRPRRWVGRPGRADRRRRTCARPPPCSPAGGLLAGERDSARPLPGRMTRLVRSSLVAGLRAWHALVARSEGRAVREIDLMAIGGVSCLERLPEGWRDERASQSPVRSRASASRSGSSSPPRPPVRASSPVELRGAGTSWLARWMNVARRAGSFPPAFPMDGVGGPLRARTHRSRARRHRCRHAGWLAGAMIAGFFVSIWLLVIGVIIPFAGRGRGSGGHGPRHPGACSRPYPRRPVPGRPPLHRCTPSTPPRSRRAPAGRLPGGSRAAPAGSVGRGQLLAAAVGALSTSSPPTRPWAQTTRR